MSIRKRNRDHLSALAPDLALVAGTDLTEPPDSDDELLFYGHHDDRPLCDLRFMRDGWTNSSNHRHWGEDFLGRAELTAELLPSIKERLMFASKDVIDDFRDAMRAWWRLLDNLEDKGLERLTSVVQISELHVRAAFDSPSINKKKSLYFRSIVEPTRTALQLPAIFWPTPEVQKPDRKLPPQEHVARIWMALKRGWFEAIDRWRRLDELVAGAPAQTPRDHELLRAHRHMKQAEMAAQAQGRNFWTVEDLAEVASVADTFKVLYPSPTEVRMAFHLYLAGSRWNPQPTVDLEVEYTSEANPTPFIREYPGNPDRYIVVGVKNRSKTEPNVVGDWKTDRSPGAILRELVRRTWPLRMIAVKKLEEAKASYGNSRLYGTLEEQRRLYRQMKTMTEVASSVWLYVYNSDIFALSETTYGGLSADPFLDRVTRGINEKLPVNKHVPGINATDFRDAFAYFAWRATGGSILHIKNELGHLSVRTTQVYLDNTVVNEECAAIMQNLTTAVFNEFRSRRKLDATVLARIVRDGDISDEDRKRLDDYRALRKSRIGIGCRDPYNPPKHIDPDFVPNGKAMCPKQRCTLCLENAVITPESLNGLAMRLEELKWLQKTMTAQAFALGLYLLETRRTELALLSFDPTQVRERRTYWRERIEDGIHLVIEFSGISRLSRKP